jgi:hypothetical protein
VRRIGLQSSTVHERAELRLAEEAARNAQHEADRLIIVAWNARMERPPTFTMAEERS